ncbi:MAG: septum formation initiator family protein [Candidatus Acidiferrales bacterium]
MGKQLGRRNVAKKTALERDANPARVGFADQMSAFLRRNMNWILVAGFALLLLQDIFGTHGVLAMRRTQLQAKEVQREIERLNEENRKLQNRVQHLKSDPATLEGIARDEMHLKRPGEYVFPIQVKPSAPSASQPADPQKKP